MPDAAALPDNVDALKVLVLAERHGRGLAEAAQRAAKAEAAQERAWALREKDRNDRLEKLLEEFKRALFGRRSEKLSPDQLELGLEDLEALGDAETDPDIELRRHNHERRVAAVLGPTLAALSPAERLTLEFAALLPAETNRLSTCPW